MQGGSKSTGKRYLSVRGNDLEDYFAELESDEGNPHDGVHPSDRILKRADGLSASEELRRLTVYVVHLRDRMSGMVGSRENAQTPRKVSGLAAALAGLTAMIAIYASIAAVTAVKRRR
jgi:hypothetical protein